MVYNLEDPKKFLTVAYGRTQDDQIGVYELQVGLDSYPVDQPGDWKHVKTLDITSESLKVKGHTLNSQQVKSLVKKLRTKNLVVNCDGACYMKNYKFDMGPSVVIKGYTYLRLADAFPWPEHGVTESKFKGFDPPKYVTSGSDIDPNNLASNNNNNNNQAQIDSLQKQLKEKEGELKLKLQEWRNRITESFELAVKLGGRPLPPSAFTIHNYDNGVPSDVKSDPLQIVTKGKTKFIDDRVTPYFYNKLINSKIDVHCSQLSFDTTFWWIIDMATHELTYAYYDGLLGNDPCERPEIPSLDRDLVIENPNGWKDVPNGLPGTRFFIQLTKFPK